VRTLKFWYAKITVLILIILTAGIAFAAETSSLSSSSSATVTASVRIRGGNLSAETTDFEFENMDFSEDYCTAIAENTITVNNPTGASAGWNVTVKASDLASTDKSRIISLDSMIFEIFYVSQENIANKVNSVATEQRIRMSFEEQKLVTTAKKSGMGQFLIKPKYKLTIPENTKPGAYTGLMTYTIFQGP
jgi:hypothetical protein